MSSGSTGDLLGTRDRVFLERRRTINRFGSLALWGGLALVLLAWIAFHLFFPLLVNPYALLGRLESRTLEMGSVTTLALVGQFALNLVFLMLTALCAFTLGWAWQERRYQRIVEKLSRAAQVASLEAQAAPATPAAGPSPAREAPAQAATPPAAPERGRDRSSPPPKGPPRE
jgi:hypothetical protein